MTENEQQSRRRFLIAGAAMAVMLADSNLAIGQDLQPTPECKDGDAPTVRQTEGPFFKPRSPQRSNLLEAAYKGRVVELSGLVLTRGCKPLGNVLVDLWHADETGEYDNRGSRYRGHQLTDSEGRYRFRTAMPAVYPGRTRHYHVKVQAERQPVLTTQLYFPDEPGNRRDPLFKRELLMRMADAGGVAKARFDFVLDLR